MSLSFLFIAAHLLYGSRVAAEESQTLGETYRQDASNLNSYQLMYVLGIFHNQMLKEGVENICKCRMQKISLHCVAANNGGLATGYKTFSGA